MEELPTCIVDKLYLGSWQNIQSNVCKVFNIDVVICLALECQYDDIPNVLIYRYGYIDSTSQSILCDINDILEIIHNSITNNKNVFVHCVAGKSRSASIVIAYIMKYCNMTLRDAYCHVKNLRHIYPNMEFIKQLITFEIKEKNLTESTFDLNDYIIESMAFQMGRPYDVVNKIYFECDCNIDKTMQKLFTYSK
jgi:protein-tyrosine phosphatase